MTVYLTIGAVLGLVASLLTLRGLPHEPEEVFLMSINVICWAPSWPLFVPLFGVMGWMAWRDERQTMRQRTNNRATGSRP